MRLSAQTNVYGVIGDPVSHSLSPLIHNRWIGEAGIDAVYIALHLKGETPVDDLRSLAHAGICGLNITLPHKGSALTAALRSSPEAQRIGAANTLTREEAAHWRADNTDTAGFSEAMRQMMGEDLRNQQIVLIGAGGAARAAAFVLAKSGVRLAIANRSRANAEKLAADLAPGAETWGMDQLGRLAEEADAVVNSASLGHTGEALPQLPAGRGRPFLDLSYGKAARETLLHAKAAGWAPHDGLVMLVAQAAEAFSLWFGLKPDLKGATDACRAELAGQA